MASSQRLKKVNKVVKQELGKIILKEVEFPKTILVTLTDVEVSKDLREGKVFVSVIPEEKTKDIFKVLNKGIYQLQQLLNSRLRMRPVPKIRFLEERGLKEAEKVDKILDKIKEKSD